MSRVKITPDEPEARITDAYSGGQKGSKLARYDLIPVAPLEELAKVYGAGARKYDDRNWEKGYAWSLSYAAMMRHLQAFWDGEDLDIGTSEEPGTQRHHLANAIFHAMALMEMQLRGKGTDDRPEPSSSLERYIQSTFEADQDAWNAYYRAQEKAIQADILERTDTANAHFHTVTREATDETF